MTWEITVTCPCHDPTVFGHLTCSRAETQPNNTLPPLPESVHFTRLDAGTITAGLVTCGIQAGQISGMSFGMEQLNTNLRETAQHVEDLAAVLEYIERRQNDPPPPHG